MEEALIKRILPHSIEAEQSVIGSMLLDRDAILVQVRKDGPACHRGNNSCFDDSLYKEWK